MYRAGQNFKCTKNMKPSVSILICFFVLASSVFGADGDDAFELEPVFVYGKNRGPKMGYTPPPIFDPLNDPLYLSGYKDFRPSGVPIDLKNVDAMTRIKKLGRITACADAWFWPFSRTARENEADGLEIEILETIAKKYDWEYEIMWINMKTRFGPGAPGGAYDRSINKGGCDIVLGLAISGDDHHMAPNELVFSKPFMSTGFVMVTQGRAKTVKTLGDAKIQNMKVGVPAYSPMAEYAESNGIPYTTFFQNYRVIDAMVRGEINVAMIWSGAISQAKLDRPQALFELVEGYTPVPEMSWDSAWVIKEKEVDLVKFINESFVDMLETGEIKRIVERYGMPFYPPKGIR